MHYEELLKTYELDPDIFNLDTDFSPTPASDLQRKRSPTDDVKDNQHEEHTKASSQPVLESHSEDKPKLSVDCLNCRHRTFEKEEGECYDHCRLQDTHIDDLEKDSCSSFQRGQCKTCGFFENGRCDCERYLEAKEKSPEDECEFDMRVFM